MNFAGSALAGAIGLMGAAACRPMNNSFQQPSPFHLSMHDLNDSNFSLAEKKDEKKKEHYKRHDIICKNRKEAKEKANQYGGGPPEGPHHDEYGSHFHATRRKKGAKDPIKIPSVHFKYKVNKPTFYRIQPGDCLSKIAQRFNVTVKNLVDWNNIANPDLIYAGTTLKIYC